METRDRRHDAIAWLVLLILPWALLSVNEGWMLTQPGTIDGWVYFGFFTNFGRFLHLFSDTYYATRLAWIVPGALAHSWLPPMAANRVLHVAVYYAAVGALYYTLRQTVGRRVALVVAIVTGSFSFFLRAVGWHYVDGAGLAYYLLAIACLTGAVAARDRKLPLFGAGFWFGAAIHTNMAWAIMLPALGWYGFVGGRERGGDTWLRDGLAVLTGVVSVTLLLGAVSVANGGSLWFFMPSLTHVSALARQSKPYQHDTAAWLNAARFLIIPGLLLLMTAYTRISPSAVDSRQARLFAGHFVLACAPLVAADLAGRTLLQNGAYYAYLIPAMALAAGALLRDPLSRLGSGHYIVLVAVTIVAFVAPFTPSVGVRLAAASIPSVVGAAVAVAAATLWVRSSPALPALVALILSASALNIVTTEPSWDFDVASRRDMYQVTVEAAEALKTLDGDTAARYWYDEASPLGNVFMSIASTRLWGFRLLSGQFPSLWNELTGRDSAVESGQDLVVIAPDRTAFAQAAATLDAHGLGATLVASREVTHGDIHLVLLQLRTQIDPRMLEEAPLDVTATSFLEGSTMRAAKRVTIDAEQDRVEVVTNVSAYDIQIISRSMTVVPGARYVADFELAIPAGGAGIDVVAVGSQGHELLASLRSCEPMPRPRRQQLSFGVPEKQTLVALVLGNCGFPKPVASRYTVQHLRFSRYR